MGKDSRSKDLGNVGQTAGNAYNNLQRGPTPLETESANNSQAMWGNYQNAVGQNTQDYSNIMGGYNQFSQGLGGPTKFSYRNVNADRPAELGESYGYLREAMPGYRDFASTGGYSPTDIQELRARGVSPIRSAYSNTMMEMDRARALGGAGGAPNYIAAMSKAQREMPGQMADAMTGVNAELANSIRQGKMFGLQGITGTGATMGGLSSQEAGRMLQASMANQNADLQAQQLSEQSLQNLRQNQLASLSGQSNLYGTTPGMSSMFGNQALQAYGQRGNLEQMRNNYGLGLLGVQNQAYGNQTPQEPWWKQVLGAAGSVVPYLGPIKKLFGGGKGPAGPMGNYSPNDMGGQGFQGYMGLPNAPGSPGGNYNPNVNSSYSFPGYPGSGGGNSGGGYDPNLDFGNWFGANGGFSGWEDNGWWGSNNGGGMDSGWFPSGNAGNYSEQGGWNGMF